MEIKEDTVLTESDVLEETFKFLSEKSIMKLDANSAKKRMLTQASLIAAKEANDPLYVKYVKASKKRRELRAILHKKYQAQGAKKVREWSTQKAHSRTK